MSEQSSTPSAPTTSGLIWRNGLIFGVIIAAIGVVNTVIPWANGSLAATAHSSGQNAGNPTAALTGQGPSLILACVLFLVNLALFFIAGMLTTRQNGRVGSGALTGLVAGAFGSLINGVVSLIASLTVVVPNITAPPGSPVPVSQLQQIETIALIVVVVIQLLFYTGVGAGLGSLGGLVGRNSYQTAHPAPTYEQSFYGGLQPGAYPPAPGYPLPQGPYAPPPGYPAAPGQQPPAPGQQPPAPPTQG
jgi:hypothetical protein